MVGQTAPGREWLIEKFFIDAVTALDEDKEPGERLLALPPISHNADETANKRLKRAVRVKRDKSREINDKILQEVSLASEQAAAKPTDRRSDQK